MRIVLVRVHRKNLARCGLKRAGIGFGDGVGGLNGGCLMEVVFVGFGRVG